MRQTVLIIKPEAFNNSQKILKIVKNAGFRIIGINECSLDKKKLEYFCAEHYDKPWFEVYYDHMSSGPIMVVLLEKGGDAVNDLHKFVGATDPAVAEDGTLRKMFWIPGPKEKGMFLNAFHSSDSDKAADEDIAFWKEYGFKSLIN